MRAAKLTARTTNLLKLVRFAVTDYPFALGKQGSITLMCFRLIR
jgi:hypothetical protein